MDQQRKPSPNSITSKLTNHRQSNLYTLDPTELQHSRHNGSSSIPPSTPSSRSSSLTVQARSDSTSASSLLPPTHHLPNGHGFRNPWPSATSNQSNLTQFINNGIPIEIAKKLFTEIKPIKTLPADFKPYNCFPSLQDSQSNLNSSTNKLVSTWLGHAGYLVQLPIFTSEIKSLWTSSSSSFLNENTSNQKSNLDSSRSNQEKIKPFRILFDPIFSIRAGPTQWTGPKRLQPSPCHINELPRIDICLISHSHYDHLDFDTVRELAKRQPHIKYFVPLGLKSWFDSVSVPSDQIVELDWWQSSDADLIVRHSQRHPIGGSYLSSNNNQSDTSIRITCVPAQHSSGRSLFDQNSSLWCGWIIEKFSTPKEKLNGIGKADRSNLTTDKEAEQFKNNTFSHQNAHQDLKDVTRCCVYFAGDTGYRSQHDRNLICPIFKEIGKNFGPIDFSMIPIWRGGTLSFISWAGFRIADPSFLVTQHATPEDGIRIHLDVRSKHSIGIHHSCFIGNAQESLEALLELERFKSIYKVEDFQTLNGFGTVNVGETIQLDLI